MITTTQFKTLDDLYAYYNLHLFKSRLPECIVNMSRHGGSYGFFSPEFWKSTNGEQKAIHEISLNPDHINRPDIEWHSTLVHEMCHLWQQEFGKPSRSCYHNKEWAAIMQKVGLMPSSTAKAGGKRTGQHVGHYIIEDGQFIAAFNSLSESDLSDLRLLYKPNRVPPSDITTPDDDENEGDADGADEEPKSGKRIKYTCSCGNNVWGRSGLNILCSDCENVFEPNN